MVNTPVFIVSQDVLYQEIKNSKNVYIISNLTITSLAYYILNRLCGQNNFHGAIHLSRLLLLDHLHQTNLPIQLRRRRNWNNPRTNVTPQPRVCRQSIGSQVHRCDVHLPSRPSPDTCLLHIGLANYYTSIQKHNDAVFIVEATKIFVLHPEVSVHFQIKRRTGGGADLKASDGRRSEAEFGALDFHHGERKDCYDYDLEHGKDSYVEKAPHVLLVTQLLRVRWCGCGCLIAPNVAVGWYQRIR